MSCGSERRAAPCPVDPLDISQSLLKALESESDSPPWPSLHVNMDNKVRTLCCHLVLLTIRWCTCVHFPSAPVREKRSNCLKSLCILRHLQSCFLITLNVTSSRPRWRRLSGWVQESASTLPCVTAPMWITVVLFSPRVRMKLQRRREWRT